MIAAGKSDDMMDAIYSAYSSYKEGRDFVVVHGPGSELGGTELDAAIAQVGGRAHTLQAKPMSKVNTPSHNRNMRAYTSWPRPHVFRHPQALNSPVMLTMTAPPQTRTPMHPNHHAVTHMQPCSHPAPLPHHLAHTHTHTHPYMPSGPVQPRAADHVGQPPHDRERLLQPGGESWLAGGNQRACVDGHDARGSWGGGWWGRRRVMCPGSMACIYYLPWLWCLCLGALMCSTDTSSRGGTRRAQPPNLPPAPRLACVGMQPRVMALAVPIRRIATGLLSRGREALWGP